MSVQAPPTAVLQQAQGRPRLPAGLSWSKVWRGPDGTLTAHEVEVPVDDDFNIAAVLWLCPAPDCTSSEWVFSLNPEATPDNPFCTRDGQHLTPWTLSNEDSDPIAAARSRFAERLRGAYEARRDKAAAAVRARAGQAQEAAKEAAKRTAADMRGHIPSLAAAAATLIAGTLLTHATAPWVSASAGLLLATVGTVVAYLATHIAETVKARQRGEDLVGRAGRKARAHARHIASAPLAAGAWLIITSPLPVAPVTASGTVGFGFTLLLGAVLTWAVNRTHWETLWETRRRLRELARQRAEEALRRAAEEAERLARQQAQTDDKAGAAVRVESESDPLVVGRRMAALWDKIAKSPTVPAGFPMNRTKILPEETRPVTAPIDGKIVHIGWEFTIQAEPGALVGRLGSGPPPLVAAREWLAAMLERDPSTVSTVDRPDGKVNRGLLLLTDKVPLGGSVPWKGRAGVRRGSDGSIYVVTGRTILGDDAEEPIYIPGQPGGGLTVGTTGGGKSAGTIQLLLSLLAAGIFPTLYDPKQLVDYADFVGVFPIGVTREHRDVILRSHIAERRHREQHLTRLVTVDRYGRKRPAEARWNVDRDGPPIYGVWEEFHMEIADNAFVNALTEHVRLQRSSAMMTEIITQGGGLQDLNNSVLRGLLNQTRLRLYRMQDNLARLAGYNGDYSLQALPRLPGMCLVATVDGPPVPMRMAYVPRDDVDGSVYDQLYAPDMTPLLTAPKLPAETVQVFEREGLMDLWRLGQGEDGLSRLLADTAPIGLAPTVTGTGGSDQTGPAIPAADVVLAIAYLAPGCTRAQVDAHEAWRRAPGWGTPPAPSTISRAAKALEAEGLLVRASNKWTVTEKGQERAKLAAMLVAGETGQSAPTVEMSAAEQERQAEALAEAGELS